MPELDRWAMAELADLVDRVTAAYDEWRFHAVYRAIYDYVGDLSSVYLDVLKDRLYADAAHEPSRRSAQTVLAEMLGGRWCGCWRRFSRSRPRRSGTSCRPRFATRTACS